MAVEYSSVCTINPTFTVEDWEKAEPIMADFVEKTKTEKGCIYYGWCKSGNTLNCREAYVDGAAVVAHLENVGECIGALLAEGIAKLDKINIECPADQVEIVKPKTEDLGTVYFEVHSGFTNMSSATGETEGAYSLCSIHPTFTVEDWAKAEPIMADFVEKTKTEAGCVYYGWVKEGNTLRCREAYVDGAAVNAHLENVGPCIDALLAEGIAKLDSIYIQGPASEIEVVKPKTESLGTVYFEAHSGFSKYTLQESGSSTEEVVNAEPPKKKAEKRKSIMESLGLGGLFGSKSTETTSTPEPIEEPKGDIKDTDSFKYEQYESLPEFTEEHKSLMSKLLSPELFDQLKDLKTEKGYTLSNAIQTGVKTPHLGVGITAGDEESWTLFKDIMYPVIKGWHGFDPETEDHKSDLDASKLHFSAEQESNFNKYVVSTRIRAARNVSGYALPAGTLSEDRAKVQELLCQAFDGFEGELKGTYYPLEGMSEEDKTMLLNNGFLFQIPKTTNLLWHAGAARDWPKNRGIFHNDAKTALCWVNEEDHCRIISMEKGGNVKSVFSRFCDISAALAKSAEANDTKLMVSEKLGFLGTCPSNLGTGLRGSVMIVLEKLNEDVIFLEAVCEKFDLQPRGSAGEHSAAEGGKWDISNKQRIGFTEVELVQKMIDGITYIIAIEEKLKEGMSKEEIAEMLENPETLLLKPEEEDPPVDPKAQGGCCVIA